MIRTVYNTDMIMQKYCAMDPSLGLYIDSNNAVTEVDENNIYWFQVNLECPGSKGTVDFT